MTETNHDKGIAARAVAVVTGGARGIGRAIGIELARSGYDIAAIDVAWQDQDDADTLRSLETELERSGAGFLRLHGDIADLGAHDELVGSLVDHTGRIDLLVNNAGVAPLTRCDILDLTPESFDRVLATNLRGTFFFTQRIARLMIGARAAPARRPPCIIFITSVSAAVSSLSRAEYCISKAGLSMSAQLFADRLSAHDILVFEIRPGIILTAMTAPVREKYDRLISEGLIPQKRWGSPEDVAKAVAALAGGAFDFSTGAVIEVSGGMNIRRL
ncbi:MAG: 3-ketoacyl-ACP reductase [Acidobacteriia bacterium]|nr:3-ketoacyl-ACP reductase [Terriglobia bacterium]